MFGLQGPACALSIGPRWDSVNTDRDATIFKNAQTLLHIWNSIGAAYTVGHNTPKSRKGNSLKKTLACWRSLEILTSAPDSKSTLDVVGRSPQLVEANQTSAVAQCEAGMGRVELRKVGRAARPVREILDRSSPARHPACDLAIADRHPPVLTSRRRRV